MSLSSISSLAECVTSVEHDDLSALTATQRKARLVTLRQVIDRLEVAFDATVAASDSAGDGQLIDGATTTAAWLRQTLRCAPREASARLHTARTLATDEARVVVDAVRAGTITYGHLRSIAATLDELDDLARPADDTGASFTPRPHLAEAANLLVELASEVDPAQLRAASRHLRYVLDPDRGKADYERQSQVRRASLAPLLDGTWRLEMLTTAEGGALLQQLLTATGAPASADDARTATQRRHDALLDALQVAAQSNQLPVFGGLSPRILVTTPPEAFLPREQRSGTSGQLPQPAVNWRPASLPDGTPASGTLFDQLSCNPILVRVIQDRSGVVLDVGRAHRFFTAAQRTALWTRDRGCRFPGCSAPWTHAHHVQPWQQGGPTDLSNGLLLCSYHHRSVHEGTWTVTVGPQGANDVVAFAHRHGLTVHQSPLPPPDPLKRE